MNVKIVQKEKNPLLKREELTMEIKDISSTPSRKELKEKIVSETSSKPELVVVGKILQRFGSKDISVEVRIYEQEKDINKLEKHFLIRTEGKPEAKPEVKAAEKPAEEKTEKPEEKQEEKKEQ